MSVTKNGGLDDILFGDDGVKTTVDVAFDIKSTLLLSLAIFLGIVFALLIYSRFD